MEYSELTEEQKARAKACETPEELVALAREEGIELTDAQLEAVAGGNWYCSHKTSCPVLGCILKT